MILDEAKVLADLAVDEDDRRGSCKRAAGGNADQSGVGEGISKQPLHDGARCREQGAYHRGCCDPWNPDRPQHELVAREAWPRYSVAPQAERGRQPRQRNAGGAHRQGDQRRADKCDKQTYDGEGSGRTERVSAAALRTLRAVGKRRHSRQLAASTAGLNVSACGASAG